MKVNKHPKFEKWSSYLKRDGFEHNEELFLANLDKIDFSCNLYSSLKFYQGRYSFLLSNEQIHLMLEKSKKRAMSNRGSNYCVENIIKRNSCTEKEAEDIIENLKSKTKGTLDNFIKRRGKEEGVKKFEEFKNKSCSTISNYKERYGESWLEKWEYFLNSRDSSSVEFLKSKYEDDWEVYFNKQHSHLKEGHTLKGLINKHGEDKGLRLYEDLLYRKTNTLERYVEKYGDVAGSEKYIKSCELKSKYFSLESFINKYGEELGKKEYELLKLRCSSVYRFLVDKYGIKKANEIYFNNKNKDILKEASLHTSKHLLNKKRFTGGVSKSSVSFFKKLSEFLGRNLKYGSKKDELCILDSETGVRYYYDCYDKVSNTIIEFHGEPFHPKEGQYDWVSFYGKTYNDIFTKDKRKKDIAVSNGYKYIVVWSREVRNKKGEINEIKRIVYEIS